MKHCLSLYRFELCFLLNCMDFYAMFHQSPLFFFSFIYFIFLEIFISSWSQIGVIWKSSLILFPICK